MAYNQNTAYGNSALPGAHGTGLAEDAYETGRPDGLMPSTGLGQGHHQPMAGYGGGASNMKPYNNDIGIAPIGTGIIHDLTSADVNARHHATDAVVAGDLQAGHKTGLVDKVKNALPGHHEQQIGSAGAYNTTGTHVGHTGTHTDTTAYGINNPNAMYPGGVTDNANVRHQGELMGGSTYPAGQQPMHGAHRPGVAGMVDQVKNTVAGHGHQTGGVHNNDNTQTYINPTGSTGPYTDAPTGTVLAVGQDAYNTTGTDHVHGQKKGMVETIKEKVTGHGDAAHGTHHAHGHPMTSDGYRTDGTVINQPAGVNPNVDVYGHRTGTEGLTGTTYNTTSTAPTHVQQPGMMEKVKNAVMPGHAATTSPTNAYDTTHANVHSQYPGTGTTTTHPVEQKPGGIKGLISKVTGQ